MKDQIEDIKKEFEQAGASVTQSEPTPYKPQPIKWHVCSSVCFADCRYRNEQELVEAAIRDRESLELVNGDGDPGSTAESAPKVVDPLEMLNDFIGR